MVQIRQYIFSVILSAIVCSLVNVFLKNFKTKEIGRMICGIVLTISVLRPAVNWQKIKIEDYIMFYSEEAHEAAALGKEFSYRAMSDIIKLETETYILDKATDLGVAITVSVTTADSGEPVPVSVTISGQVPTYARAILEKTIEDDLGIAKENQQWHG